MAGEKYIQKAVEDLAAHMRTAIPAQLRIIETAQGLDANTIPDPVEIMEADLEDDNRSPLVEVFESGWDYLQAQRENFLAIDCQVVLSFTGDADMNANARRMRRYQTAIIDSILTDPTLAGNVAAAILTGGASGTLRGDSSTSRLVFSQGVQIQVFGGP